jgi:carbamoyl-phosphate synthase small subunit
MNDRLILQDGTVFFGKLFGKKGVADGEVVFTTGMVGYEQTLTDPSFQGQILVFTYPMIGNYGVPSEDRDEYGILKHFESEQICVRGLVVNEFSESFSHWKGVESFPEWFERKGISGISGVDTRLLTEHLRENGSMLGQIVPAGEEPSPFSEIIDPNTINLVAEVSIPVARTLFPKNPIGKTVAVFDYGIKNNILRSFLRRGVEVLQLPWDAQLSSMDKKIDGIFFSNGPGDPEVVAAAAKKNIDYSLKNNIPLWGICLGNQLLGLAIGGKTQKMKYGHRGVNQPCREIRTGRCVITSQNHGYMVDHKTLPEEWELSWENLNDGTCEGIRHREKKAFSVQFHPEADPGPLDSDPLFDEFISGL